MTDALSILPLWRWSWLLLAGGLLACAKTPPPSVLLIVADDMGWGDLSLHGNPNVRTPHLDGLARSGIAFTDFYVSAVCSPTRAELLTGRHALSIGVTGTGAGEERVDTGVVMLPQVLAKAGYRNALFGKWHNGAQAPNHPLSRGFETFFGYCEGHWATYFDAPLLERDGARIRGRGYLADELTDAAIDFLRRGAGAPTFTMLSLPTPHSPMQVPDRWFDAVTKRRLDSLGTGQGEEDPVFTQAALAMVENIDWNVGRLLRALDSLGLRQNTLVLFVSDNGPNNWRWNAGMRGRKGSVDEGGTRSPLFVSMPGSIAAGQTDASPLSVRDLMPTILDYVGVDTDTSSTVGRSFAERLGDPQARIEEAALVRTWNDRTAVRHGRYLLDEQGQLYDLITDRGQTTDIREQRTGTADSLEEARADFLFLMNRQKPTEPRPFLVGHPSLSTTSLSAGEATASRGVTTGSPHPNSGYVTSWRDTSAAMRWPVHVLRAGRYAVDIWYALDSADAVAEIEFRQEKAGRATAWRRVDVHERPVLGAAQDRVVRDESYYKDWGTTQLGNIELVAGTDTLALRCVRRIPDGRVVAAGAGGVEIRLLQLRYARQRGME